MTKSNNMQGASELHARSGARLLNLTQLRGMTRLGDLSLLGLRAMTGIFLVYGVWDNIAATDRMAEFSRFLESHEFPFPDLSASLSVAVQFTVGICFILGLATRAAGIFCVLNFLVAIAMVHWNEDLRAWWPALSLIGIGTIFSTHGSGRFGLDRLIERRIG